MFVTLFYHSLITNIWNFLEKCVLLVDYDAFNIKHKTLQLYRGSLVFDKNHSWP